jgi:hypothetical protein
MRFFAVAGLAGLLALAGCRSAYVEVKVVNEGSAPVSVVEADYPGGSFGVDTLEAGEAYNYRFKILGNGPTKVMWTDAARHDYSSAGPQLNEGQQGTMTVTILGGTAEWKSNLRP